MGRFDYVKYDQQAEEDQGRFKLAVSGLEGMIDELLISPRAKAIAIIQLEEVYMWIGKAIRDDQIDRDHDAKKTTALQEERNNS